MWSESIAVERQSTARIEVVAGVTTFLTMAYIIFVNPNILSDAGMDKSALIAVTCIVSAVATIVTGVFGKAPIAMVNKECETIVAVGAIISEIPCVDHIEIEKLKDGAKVKVDADKGTVELK